MTNLFDLQSWDQGQIQDVASELKKCSKDNQGPSTKEVSLEDSNHSSYCYLDIQIFNDFLEGIVRREIQERWWRCWSAEVQMWRQRQTIKSGSPWRDVCGNSYWLATGVDWKTLKDLTFQELYLLSYHVPKPK